MSTTAVETPAPRPEVKGAIEVTNKQIEKSKGNISQWESKLADLDRRLQEAGERQQQLERERSNHVLGALAEGDPGAQRQLKNLTSGLEQAQREQSDLQLAIDPANKKLESLRAQLGQEERSARKARILELSNQRKKTGKQIEDLITRDLGLWWNKWPARSRR